MTQTLLQVAPPAGNFFLFLALSLMIYFSYYFLTLKIKPMSDVLDQLTAKVDRIFVSTKNVASDIRGIKEQLSGGLSAEEVAALSDRLETAASTLEGLDAETPNEEAAEGGGGASE